MLTDEERELLEWQQDRHTPVVHATGWDDDALDALAFQKAIDADCGCTQQLDDFLAGKEFPCSHEYPGCE